MQQSKHSGSQHSLFVVKSCRRSHEYWLIHHAATGHKIEQKIFTEGMNGSFNRTDEIWNEFMK